VALFGSSPTIDEQDHTTGDLDRLRTELRQEQESNLLLEESIADLQLALEDRGWREIAAGVRDEFSEAGRRTVADICRTMAISNPLIKRGLTVRIGYIWGQGVQIRAKAADQADQDVNAVVQAFLDDNTKTLTGDQAHEELERALGTDGNVILACFTSPLTGRVQVRSTPFDEIADIITNPDDRDEPWFYVREFVETVIEAGTIPGSTRTRRQRRKVFHPDIAYRPTSRPRTIDGAEVRWDAPMLHIPVNRLDGWKYGVPDVYASVAWARMYREFLRDWALVVRALSKYAMRLTGGNKTRTSRAAAAVRTAAATAPTTPAGTAAGVGNVFAGSDNVTLEAIPKSGATIDADSGKHLAGMAAAGMGLPVTVLLADPGVTGARAVAETLDLPTLLEMGMRRLLWQQKLTELINYVIDQAVLAPRGPLRGTLARDDWGRLQVTLAGDIERTLEFDWPQLVDVPVKDLVAAIVDAHGTRIVPDIIALRLILAALGVKDIDEILDSVTDDQGRFIPPDTTAADVAVDAFNRGEDPAAATR